jgi:hypothetical protein
MASHHFVILNLFQDNKPQPVILKQVQDDEADLKQVIARPDVRRSSP